MKRRIEAVASDSCMYISIYYFLHRTVVFVARSILATTVREIAVAASEFVCICIYRFI